MLVVLFPFPFAFRLHQESCKDCDYDMSGGF